MTVFVAVVYVHQIIISFLFKSGNPLEEKQSSEGTWQSEVTRRLPNLRKLDGKFSMVLTAS
jgi:hypothetical protein